MGYCEAGDLLVGDIGGLEPMKAQYIDMASEDMDAAIGYVYVLPLAGLSTHANLILKGICRKLASGRMLMAQAAGNEDTTIHAYGLSLVNEAQRDLWSIRNGQTELGSTKIESISSGNAPSIIQGDEVSGVDAYYTWLGDPSLAGMTRMAPIWKPGFPA